MTETNEIEFCEEWLSLKKSHFKIIAVATVLADNKRAFRGSLNDLCAEIGVNPSSVNKRNIKEALASLEENGYIKMIVDGRTYTVSLAESVKNSKNVKTIKKAWYDLIRTTKSEEGCGWDSMLKVFIVLCDCATGTLATDISVAEQLGNSISGSTVGKCIRTLCKMDFEDFRFISKSENRRDNAGNYYCIGREIDRGIFFE